MEFGGDSDWFDEFRVAGLMSSRDRSHLKEFWTSGSVLSTGCEECLIDQWLRVSLIQLLSRSKRGVGRGGGGEVVRCGSGGMGL